MSESSAPKVRYHLRVSLIAERMKAELRALWRIVRRAQIDEVIFFVPHAEERSLGLGTLQECEACAEQLAPLFERLRQEGIAPSINVWWTVSFSDFPALPRNLRDRFHFRWAVGLDGRESRAIACPMDPAWRAHTQQLYRVFARLRPVRLWIDDDVRMTLRADLHCPCVCDACLAEMTRRTGRTFSRPELLQEILADPPNSVRDAWLEFQNDLAVDIIRGLASAVHQVSPQTHVSLMHSGCEIHWAEGRRWSQLAEALGLPAPHFRPGIGPYQDTPGLSVAESFNNTRLAQAALPAGTPIAPEIENYPHSRFGKSAKLVQADLVLAQLVGIREMTFSIYRFGGGLDLETRREKVWEELLGDLKPYLQEIADLGIAREQLRGLSLFFHEQVCHHSRGVSNEPKPIFLYRRRPWDQVLPLLGFATRYGTGDLTVFGGEAVCCLSDEELREVFSHGVLLDARAAESLVLSGKGHLIGALRRLADAEAVTETVEDRSFGDFAGDVMNLRWDGAPWQFEWRPGVRIISRVRDYEGHEAGHGVVLHENELGGRIAVYPFDSQARGVTSLGATYNPIESPSFLSWTRQAQLLAVLEWLGRGPVPLFVPQAPAVLPLLAEQPTRLIVSVTNLSADPVKNLKLRLAAPRFPVRSARALDLKGRWRHLPRAKILTDADRGTLVVRTGLRLGHWDTAIVVLEGSG